MHNVRRVLFISALLVLYHNRDYVLIFDTLEKYT